MKWGDNKYSKNSLNALLTRQNKVGLSTLVNDYSLLLAGISMTYKCGKITNVTDIRWDFLWVKLGILILFYTLMTILSLHGLTAGVSEIRGVVAFCTWQEN